MDYCDKRLRRFLLVSTAIVFVFSVVRVIMIMKYIITIPADAQQVYSIANNAVTATYTIAVCVMLALFGIYAVLKKFKNKICVSYDDSPTIFFSSLIGFMMIATSLLYFYRIMTGEAVIDKLETSVIVSMLLSSAFFLYTSSRALKQGRTLYTLLTIFPIAYTVLRVLSIFIPVRESVVDSTALFRLFGLAFTMLFFVSEIKASNDTGNRKATIFFGLSAILLNVIFQIPDLYLSAFWLLKFSFTSILTAIDLLIIMYIFARLLAMTAGTEIIDIKAETTL